MAELIRLNQQGFQQVQSRQFQAALQSFQQALVIAREVQDRAGEGVILSNIATVYLSEEQYTQALDFYQQALAIHIDMHDRAAEGITLSNIGEIYRNQGQYPQALNSYQQALVIAREVGDRIGEGTTLSNIGLAYDSQGQYPQALNSFQQALVISREVRDPAMESTTLFGIADIYSSQGQYPQALNFFQQALVVGRTVHDRAGEGRVLSGIGVVYLNQGQYPQALNSFQQALVIATEMHDPQTEGRVLTNIGVVYLNQGQYPQALNSFQQALAINREQGDHAAEGVTLNNIGQVYLSQGQYPQALNSFQQALAINRELGDRAEGAPLANIGEVYRAQGQYLQALDFYQQALVASRGVDDRAGEGVVLNNIGVTLLQTGQFAQATEQLDASIDVLESLRPAEMSDAAKIAIFDSQATPYNFLQQALIAQNQPGQALAAAERGRGRALVALLSNQSAADGASANNVPSIDQIQQIARTQNATLVVYSQIETVEGDRSLYAWVVKPTGEITFRQTALTAQDGQPASPNAIALLDNPGFRAAEPDATTELVANARSALGVRDRGITVTYEPGAAQPDRLRQLHQLLIEPIADLLPTNPSDRIVFIPQGSLFLVPFAALQDANGEYLIQQHTISIAPSIQVLGLTDQQQQRVNEARSTDNVLVVGNPTMPTLPNYNLPPLAQAGREAEAIARFFDTEAMTGDRATETVIKQQMTQARIVHLATHGLLDYGNPQATGVRDTPGAIALAPSATDDGLLTSSEIYQMNLNADLVVLSACDTGLGDIRGDGVVGLSRSLIQAGVPSVVVSLWSVPDAPTADLMTEFYRQLQQNPDKAQALRQAMLITMQQHPDPIDWAAFTLVGEAE